MQKTPNANRFYIGVYGKRNVGKSSLINYLTGQQTSLVSEEGGTTADPVKKPMEIHGLGPVVLVDTAGIDDTGKLGALRVKATLATIHEVDVAILVTDCPGVEEEELIRLFEENQLPWVAVVNKSDESRRDPSKEQAFFRRWSKEPIWMSAVLEEGKEPLLSALAQYRDHKRKKWITRGFIEPKDSVLLVMPQDGAAPEGRLILPQVQVIRELLDIGAVITCVTTDFVECALHQMKSPPKLVITDSNVFSAVDKVVPEPILLTSFSILMAGYKGDLSIWLEGAKKLENLASHSAVLIAEACTHSPIEEDIGRVKIPNLLRRQWKDLRIDFTRGLDFPQDLTTYDLVIHCGGCMLNDRVLYHRLSEAKRLGVAITNYGMAIATLMGIRRAFSTLEKMEGFQKPKN